jgi:hypothetical protein
LQKIPLFNFMYKIKSNVLSYVMAWRYPTFEITRPRETVHKDKDSSTETRNKSNRMKTDICTAYSQSCLLHVSRNNAIPWGRLRIFHLLSPRFLATRCLPTQAVSCSLITLGQNFVSPAPEQSKRRGLYT